MPDFDTPDEMPQSQIQRIADLKCPRPLKPSVANARITAVNKSIQKQVKQRKDSVAIFLQQGREDLATPELQEIAVLEQFLPKALSEEEVAAVVIETITSLGASGMQDMGKVMGVVSKKLAGQADGKMIADLVKKHLL